GKLISMVERLLKQLESPRRHLAVLVGLLVMTFVFTGLLAWEARRAELSRQETAHGVLRDMVSRAAQDWAFYLQQFTGSSLESAARESFSVLISNPDMSAADVPIGDALTQFCQDCAANLSKRAFDLRLD